MSIIPNDNQRVRKPPIGVVLFCLYAFLFNGIIQCINALIVLDTYDTRYPSFASYPPILISSIGYFLLVLSCEITFFSIFAMFGKDIARKSLLVLFTVSQVFSFCSLVLKFPIGTGTLFMQVFSCGHLIGVIVFSFYFIQYFKRPSVKAFFS